MHKNHPAADVPALYARLAAAGFTYGPQFRTLTEAWVGAGEAVGVVAAPAGAADYFVHPGVLDGAFHVTDLCCPGGMPVRVASRLLFEEVHPLSGRHGSAGGKPTSNPQRGVAWGG